MMNLVRFHLGQAVTERCDAERGDEAGDKANNCLGHYTRAAGLAGFPTSLINERKPTAGLHRKLPGGDSTLQVLGLWDFEAGASVWSRLAWLLMEEISAGASLRRNELPKPRAGVFGVGGFAATSCLWGWRQQIEPLGRDLLSPGCLNGHLELRGGKEHCRDEGEGEEVGISRAGAGWWCG